MEKALTVDRWIVILTLAAALTAAAIWAGISIAGGSGGGPPAGRVDSGAPPVFVQQESPAQEAPRGGHDGECPFDGGAGSSSSPSTDL